WGRRTAPSRRSSTGLSAAWPGCSPRVCDERKDRRCGRNRTPRDVVELGASGCVQARVPHTNDVRRIQVSVRDREDAVVARLQALATDLDGEPDPAFRAATRARLVAMAAVRTPAPEPLPGVKRLLALRAPDRPPARW